MLIYSVVALAAIIGETNVEKPATPPPPVVMVPTIPIATMPVPKKGGESGPLPKNYPGTWANTNNYPVLALKELREGVASFTVDVSLDGRVEKCVVTETSGHTDLDQATCDSVTARAQFYPAQDRNGLATTGRYSNRVRWQIPEALSFASMPRVAASFPRPPKPSNREQMTIAADKYPAAAAAAGQRGDTTFLLNVDETGQVRNCTITLSSNVPELDQQACAIARGWIFDAALDIDGRPTAGKSSHTLTWRLPKSAPKVSLSSQRKLPTPFMTPGSITLSLEFDDKGKMINCATDLVGDQFASGAGKVITDSACRNDGDRDIAPFLDATGKPIGKRVKLKLSVEHEDATTRSARE